MLTLVSIAADVPGATNISAPALQKVTAGIKSLQTNLAKVEHRISASSALLS
jgi:phosphoribosyl-dephospho-CoA transferase